MPCAHDCRPTDAVLCESCDPPAPLPMPAYDTDAYALYEIRLERSREDV